MLMEGCTRVPGCTMHVHTWSMGHHSCTHVCQACTYMGHSAPCMHIYVPEGSMCTEIQLRPTWTCTSVCMHTYMHSHPAAQPERTHTHTLTHTHAATRCHRSCPFAAPAPAFITPAPCSRASVSPFERARGFSSGPEAARGWILPRDSQPGLIIHLLLARSPSWGHSSRLLPRTRGP